MNWFKYLVIFLIFVNSIAYSMSRLELDSYQPRGLLIFLDDSEGANLAAVSSSVLTALSQKAGPMIVSGSLLHGIFGGYRYQKRGESPEQLQREYQSLRNRAIFSESVRFILLEASQFDDSEWYFKKINDFLYLVIPKQYLYTHGISTRDFEFSNASNVTEAELKIGLKVNHMETVNFDQFRNPVSQQPRTSYFLNALYNASTNSSSIFCIRSDYLNKSIKRPLWTIYMDGHGKLRNQIVGISLHDFKKVLDFFEYKINIGLLVYTSCYAAGLNNEVIFKDSKNALERTYSYAIITHASTDAPTTEIVGSIEVQNNRLIQESYRDFAKFLNKVTGSDTFDYESAIENIFPALPRIEMRIKAQETWANLPQIKLPGVEWFSVVAGHKDVVSIGSILAKTRGNKPLNVVNFFNADPIALLLFATDIPFELIISKKLSAIISMIPGDAIHTIAKILSSDSKVSVYDVVNLFMKIDGLAVDKIFYIKEIGSGSEIIQDVIVYYRQIPVRFGDFELDLGAYFKKGGKVFKMARDEKMKGTIVYGLTPQPKEVLDKSWYEQMLVRFQGGIKQIKEVKLQSYQALLNQSPFDVIGDNAVATIDKITTLKSSRELITIGDIYNKLKFANSIVWVKEMNGFYESEKPFDILKLQHKDPVILQDVIVDGINNKTLFSYNGKFYEGDFRQTGKEVSDYRHEYEQRMKQGGSKAGTEEGLSPQKIQELMIFLEKGIKRGSLPTGTQPTQQQIKPVTPAQSIPTQSVQTQTKPITPLRPIPTPQPTSIPVPTKSVVTPPQSISVQVALQELAVRLNDLSLKVKP